MGAYRRYDEVAVGDIYPDEPLTFDVSAKVVDALLSATGNDGSLYRERSGSEPRWFLHGLFA